MKFINNFKPKKGNRAHLNDGEDYLNLDRVASSTDCTGLMPTPPLSEHEEGSYTDLNSIPKVENEVNNGLQTEKKADSEPAEDPVDSDLLYE